MPSQNKQDNSELLTAIVDDKEEDKRKVIEPTNELNVNEGRDASKTLDMVKSENKEVRISTDTPKKEISDLTVQDTENKTRSIRMIKKKKKKSTLSNEDEAINFEELDTEAAALPITTFNNNKETTITEKKNNDQAILKSNLEDEIDQRPEVKRKDLKKRVSFEERPDTNESNIERKRSQSPKKHVTFEDKHDVHKSKKVERVKNRKKKQSQKVSMICVSRFLKKCRVFSFFWVCNDLFLIV